MGPVVESEQGRVQGAREDGLDVFRGIPFAAPPVGDLRFRAPLPVEPWSGTRDALKFGPAAPQNVGPLMHLVGAADLPTDEDCLTLNLWTPECDSSARPVLVWIHGGGYATGSASMPMFDGGPLARRGDVVVVTLNYRLGALGFLGLSETGDRVIPGNLGLRDLIAGLEWVRDNATRFGGDPERVTLFGESAGSMSIGVLLGLPRARGLFQRAILQSGAPSATGPEEADRILGWLLAELGLDPGDAGKLSQVPSDRFLEAQARVNLEHWRELTGLAFRPVDDGDLVPAPPRELLASGAGRGVDLLLGTNLDECRYWGVTDTRVRSLDRNDLLRRFRHHVKGTDESGISHAERLLELYEETRQATTKFAPPDLWFALETDRLFRIPTTRLAEVQGEWANIFAYLFTWPSPALDGQLGSCHGLEVPFVFGSIDVPAMRFLVGEGPEPLALSLQMQDAWISFAREGRPEGDRWPAYDTERRATRLLGLECGLEDAPFEAERRGWEGLL